MTDDFTASLNVDGRYLMSALDLVFGPHGTDFVKPANLKIHVKGMDLSSLDENETVSLYYETGAPDREWMER